MLYIGVDGVAPMAKIKQQRMRRFKSAVGAEEEAKIKASALGTPYTPSPRWDTNAITPGTSFMNNLAIALRNYQKTDPTRIIVSPADVAGEGEQKIMDFLRANTYTDCVIYGLDADLIVLSMWAGAKGILTVDLFREETEFTGGVKENALGEEEYLYLTVGMICDSLFESYGRSEQRKQEFIHDYVGIMNILGNDFVPHGLSVKIKAEGIEVLLAMYKHLETDEDLVYLDNDVYSYNVNVLYMLFQKIAEQEPLAILKSIRMKLDARIGMSASSKTDVEKAMSAYNDKPVEWAVERPMIRKVMMEGRDKPVWVLVDNWKEIYDSMAFFGTSPDIVTKYYFESLAWTLAYYSGTYVDTQWYYPWWLPPRFESMLDTLKSMTSLSLPNTSRSPLNPIEQLAMVLPQTSFQLLPSEYAELVKAFPQYWPIAWASYSFGRRYLWECEPMIPLIPPGQIRKMIDTVCDS